MNKVDKLKRDLKPSKGDVSHALISGGISFLVPQPLGPLFAALFGSVILPPPITQRCEKWLIKFCEDIEELKNQNKIDIESLAHNEAFLTILTKAYQLVIQNHQKEKLEALRNAVLNSALPDALEDDLQVMFLNFVDSFTITHFKILNVFYVNSKSEIWIQNISKNLFHDDSFVDSNGEKVDKYKGKTYRVMSFDLWNILVYEYPEFGGKYHIYEYIMEDLTNHGILFGDTRFVNLCMNTHFSSNLEGLGKQFMDFITSPLNNK